MCLHACVDEGGATIFVPITFDIVDEKLHMALDTDQNSPAEKLGFEFMIRLTKFFSEEHCVVGTLTEDRVHESGHVNEVVIQIVKKRIEETS